MKFVKNYCDLWNVKCYGMKYKINLIYNKHNKHKIII